MPTVRFTQNIQRHVECPPRELAGETVRELLDAYFAENGRAQGYVVDEQGALRQHMLVFINGKPIQDRNQLSDAVCRDDTVDVMQALSGG